MTVKAALIAFPSTLSILAETLESGKRKGAATAAIEALLQMIRERSWYEAHYAFNALHRIDPSRW